jgi:hypothetical protein
VHLSTKDGLRSIYQGGEIVCSEIRAQREVLKIALQISQRKREEIVLVERDQGAFVLGCIRDARGRREYRTSSD